MVGPTGFVSAIRFYTAVFFSIGRVTAGKERMTNMRWQWVINNGKEWQRKAPTTGSFKARSEAENIDVHSTESLKRKTSCNGHVPFSVTSRSHSLEHDDKL